MNPFRKSKKQLSIFFTAGFPKINSTIENILLCQRENVDFVEIGIPFSDPLADGPVIQGSSDIAIANGMNIDLLFEQIENNREKINIPLVLMGYFNPVYKYGIQKFMQRADELNIKGIIIPDLPFELYTGKFLKDFEKFKTPLVQIITPETESKKIEAICNKSENSFIYLVRSSATTGSQQNFINNDNLIENVVKECQNIPVMIGFGIKSMNDVLKAQSQASGAIIGTEFIRQLNNGTELEFLRSLNLS